MTSEMMTNGQSKGGTSQKMSGRRYNITSSGVRDGTPKQWPEGVAEQNSEDVLQQEILAS
jgi:hypothetical protein